MRSRSFDVAAGARVTGTSLRGDVTDPAPRRWPALALLCTAVFMVILDASIVTVAVPSIQRHLGFSAADVQWVLAAYVVTFGGLLLSGGRAADIFGRRRLFMAGVALFAGSSLVCGLAGSSVMLIAARAVQGVSAAVMTPTALSIVLGLFEEGAERNKALGVWGAVAAAGGTAGSLGGGPLTQWLGWEWIFFINVPIGLVLLALSAVLLPASRERGERRPLDTAGALTITAALGLLVFGVSQTPVLGWTNLRTLGALGTAAIGGLIFVLIETRSQAPLVPLRLLRSRALVSGNLVTLAGGMAAFGQGFILTQYAQDVLGWSPARFGLSFAVMPLMAIAGSIAGQRVITRFGPRPVAIASMALLGLAFVWWARVPVQGSFVRDLFPGMVLFGLGLGASGVAAAIVAVGSVSERDSGLASGINNAAFQVGGALGVAVLSTTAISRTEQLLATGHQVQSLFALTEGYRLAFLVAVGFALVGLLAPLVLLARSGSLANRG